VVRTAGLGCDLTPGKVLTALLSVFPIGPIASDSIALIVLGVKFELKTAMLWNRNCTFTQVRNGSTQHHVAYPLFSFVKAYGNWSKVYVQQYYMGSDIRVGDTVVIHFHNPGNKPFEVKDVEVSGSVMPH
jgi:hypothetical protein